jgi:hypothetical protein
VVSFTLFSHSSGFLIIFAAFFASICKAITLLLLGNGAEYHQPYGTDSINVRSSL